MVHYEKIEPICSFNTKIRRTFKERPNMAGPVKELLARLKKYDEHCMKKNKECRRASHCIRLVGGDCHNDSTAATNARIALSLQSPTATPFGSVAQYMRDERREQALDRLRSRLKTMDANCRTDNGCLEEACAELMSGGCESEEPLAVKLRKEIQSLEGRRAAPAFTVANFGHRQYHRKSSPKRLPLPAKPPEAPSSTSMHVPSIVFHDELEEEQSLDKIATKGWVPVTERAELFAYGAEGLPARVRYGRKLKKMKITARSIMWSIVRDFAASHRQLLYRAEKDVDSYVVDLAVVSDDAAKKYKRGPKKIDAFGLQSAVEKASEHFRGGWVETAVGFAIDLADNAIRIDLLFREENQPSFQINPEHALSTSSRLIVCFALAMAAHIFRLYQTFHNGTFHEIDLQTSIVSVSLPAEDLDSEKRGRLIKYFRDNYGMALEKGQLEGSLLTALQRCHGIWRS